MLPCCHTAIVSSVKGAGSLNDSHLAARTLGRRAVCSLQSAVRSEDEGDLEWRLGNWRDQHVYTLKSEVLSVLVVTLGMAPSCLGDSAGIQPRWLIAYLTK